jgi:NMT1-like family
VQIVAAKSGGPTAVEGFRGKRVALGPERSGTEQNALQMLDVYGLKVTDLARADRIDPAAAVTRMKAGQLDAAFFTVGAGSGLVGDLLSDDAPSSYRSPGPRWASSSRSCRSTGSTRFPPARILAKLPRSRPPRSGWLRVITAPIHPGTLRLYRERNIQQ